jgi:hypothetical protein
MSLTKLSLAGINNYSRIGIVWQVLSYHLQTVSTWYCFNFSAPLTLLAVSSELPERRLLLVVLLLQLQANI